MELGSVGKRHKTTREKTVRTNKKMPESLKSICGRYKLPVFRVNEKEISGVYFLCKDGKVDYVGQSKDIKERIRTHRKEKRKSFDSIFALKLPQELLLKIEETFIVLLCPKYNNNGGHSLQAIDRALRQTESWKATTNRISTEKMYEEKR